MEEIIKILFAIGIPIICIWGANGCYEIMEGNDKKYEKIQNKIRKNNKFYKK